MEGLLFLESGPRVASSSRADVDLILLDVEMPRLTGPEMAYRLFVLDAGKEKIPIVLLSANLDLPRVAATVVGTPYCLAKPYPIDDLFSPFLVDRASARRARTAGGTRFAGTTLERDRRQPVR
jgi:CheY-like chemotaxis protein